MVMGFNVMALALSDLTLARHSLFYQPLIYFQSQAALGMTHAQFGSGMFSIVGATSHQIKAWAHLGQDEDHNNKEA